MHGGGGRVHHDGITDDVGNQGRLELDEAVVAREAKVGSDGPLDLEDGILNEFQGSDVLVFLGQPVPKSMELLRRIN